jgi:isochorismate hydrolase
MESALRAWGSTCVVVAGVMTHLCCESTARDAFMRGFDVVVAADGTATLNEALHVASLRGLSHGFAVPARVSELMEGLAR